MTIGHFSFLPFVNMDGSLLQLDCVDQELPILLCQYTYFLNKIANKVLFIGFDSTTFRPVIQLLSLDNNQRLCFSFHEWACVSACMKYCIKFLKGSSDIAWYSSQNLVIESFVRNDERLIKISNLDAANSVIELNLEEFENLDSYSPFLSRIFKHYNEHWFDVEVYYRTYVLKCLSVNKCELDITEYFTPANRCLNYFRIFNEIPIICKNKLTVDLVL